MGFSWNWDHDWPEILAFYGPGFQFLGRSAGDPEGFESGWAAFAAYSVYNYLVVDGGFRRFVRGRGIRQGGSKPQCLVSSWQSGIPGLGHRGLPSVRCGIRECSAEDLRCRFGYGRRVGRNDLLALRQGSLTGILGQRTTTSPKKRRARPGCSHERHRRARVHYHGLCLLG